MDFNELSNEADGLPVCLLLRILLGGWDFNLLPTSGFSMKPLKVKLVAGEQKATQSPPWRD